MKYLIVLACIIFGTSSWALTEKKSEKVEKVKEEVKSEILDQYKKWGAYGSFSYLDTWLPSKIGLTGVYNSSAHRSWELAYQSASLGFEIANVDIGKITDTRLHFATRSHTWEGSFNFTYGAYYHSFSAKLGNTYTDIAGASTNVVEIQKLGVMWGLGNRWSWDNGFSLGVDWFKIFWPLYDMKRNDDYLDEASAGDERDDVKQVLDVVSNIPMFSIAHLEIGYRF